MVDRFSNAYQTTLNGSITNVATTLVVTSATGAPVSVPFRLRIKADGANTTEIVTVTAVASTTFTISRASESYAGVQSASAHGDGATIEHVLTAGGLIEISKGIVDSTPLVITSNDDEFNVTDTSDPMTGWTTVGSPAVMNIHSDLEDHLHLVGTVSGSRLWQGIYKAIPSMPFTVTAKLSASDESGQFNTAGLFIAEATPGKIEAVGVRVQSASSYSGQILTLTMTSPTGTAALVTNTSISAFGPLYLRGIITSSTNITWQFSFNGLLWTTVNSARNPSMTIGSVGLAVMSEISAGSHVTDTYWDWIRFS